MLNVITVEFDSALPTVKPPTFLDVGVSQAYLPWEQRLDVLLHTPQATANLIEDSIWDSVNHTLIPELAGLPFVEIYTKSGQYVASTLDLPHRLGTGYLLKNKHAQLDGQRFREGLRQRIRHSGVYQAAFALCPMSIVLGSFYTHIAGVYRIPRVLSGEFVAENAISMPTGGAVHDPVSARGKGVNLKHMFAVKNDKDQAVKKPSEAGLGNIVYVRESFKAQRYLGRFVIDTRLVDKSNLDSRAKHLIQVLSEYLIRRLLSEPVTLRTECYLIPKSETSMQKLPAFEELEQQLKAAINNCQDLFEKVRVVVPDDQVQFAEEEEAVEA
ncbi:type I-U CRISPR-associated RAMP protein Csb1/Cas7u [Gloeocapsopsis sp. IPPAS B-1203]|uniref:type I-G CRISPR-associated RAMP protein Csb1/Cas7g n=1 Tax=Gloeocapsopsis sp. IPPAS B-1203 TaxID=2049454 RepID=UPI000C186B4D|nr:type I-U CRISPR-associated RAMP protein Csb1/Cas7u [Gloeocapsopsis sp. IPPAS B-1203]PIG90923.1 type I-U CRISPR-associated protein Cas7 [Gloeocapsopsis sp. IPPAS B-1203]